MTETERDNAGVIAPPPLIYAGPLMLGLLSCGAGYDNECADRMNKHSSGCGARRGARRAP